MAVHKHSHTHTRQSISGEISLKSDNFYFIFHVWFYIHVAAGQDGKKSSPSKINSPENYQQNNFFRSVLKPYIHSHLLRS